MRLILFRRESCRIEENEITLKLYSPLTGDFYKNDVDEYGWNNGVADYPTLFSGVDMAYYEESIREAVEQRDSDDGGNLMPYFDEDRNPGVRKKVLSAVPTVEIRDGELMGCTTVKLKEPLTEAEAGSSGLSQRPVFRWLGRGIRAAGNPDRRWRAVRSFCRRTL